MLQWLTGRRENGNNDPADTALSPRAGAAGLLIEAAHRDGHYSEVEASVATSQLMQLFRLDRKDAAALRVEAERAQDRDPSLLAFAIAARGLSTAEQERLVRRLWVLVDAEERRNIPAHTLMETVTDILGVDAARADSLRQSAAGEVEQ